MTHNDSDTPTLTLHRDIAACLGRGDIFGALRVCAAEMARCKGDPSGGHDFTRSVEALTRLTLDQFGKGHFLSVVGLALEILAGHSLYSKNIVKALGQHYEHVVNLTNAYSAYNSNVEQMPGDGECWQDLLRVATALAVTTTHDMLDSHLARLRQQSTQLFLSAVTATLDKIEPSRPEDLYLLASRAHAAMPADAGLWWYWLNAMSFLERDTPEECAQHTIAWAGHFASTQPKPAYAPVLAPLDNRRIRIGYIASRLHFMFLKNHLEHHDFDRFDVYLFTDDPRCVPQRFGPHITIVPLGPGDPTDRLRQANLDIAIDMMGPSYRAHWRGVEGFAAFVNRVAPVQCHWISTTGTTGSAAGFDYLLADAGLVPPALEHLYVERIERLAEVAHCWSPPHGDVALAPPFRKNGFITFGSANRGTKITHEQLARWASVVAAVPDSRMVIKGSHASDPLFVARATEVFSRYGMQGRVAFQDATPHPAFPSSFYSTIDISLDTYPYTGGITTLESLWNGVPVVTRTGHSFVSRLASDYLNVIGRSSWVAESDEAYVEIAAGLAADQEALAQVRGALRPSLAASPLLDGQRFARNLEAAFLEMLHER